MQSTREPPCHTCRRQRLRCDGVKPSCNKCAIRGVECLGYGAQPLLWVQPRTNAAGLRDKLPKKDDKTDEKSDGRPIDRSPDDSAIGRATGKKRGRPRLVLMNPTADGKPKGMRTQPREFIPKGNQATGRRWLPLMPNLNPPGYEADRLAIYCITYYNDHICPDLVLFDNDTNPHRLPAEYWSYFPEIMVDMIISAALTTQVIRSEAGRGSLTNRTNLNGESELKRHHLGAMNHPSIQTIYKHQRAMLRSLNAELGNPHAKYSDSILGLIVSLMRCEIQQSAFGAWPAHLEAARAIIAHRGGFTALAEAEGGDLNHVLSNFLLVDIMSTTMTPTGLLGASTVNQLEYIPYLPIIYKDGLESGFPCPNELVECLIRINHLRSLSFLDSKNVQQLADGLICRIVSFFPKAWADRQYRSRTQPLGVSVLSYRSSSDDSTIDGSDVLSETIPNDPLTLSPIASATSMIVNSDGVLKAMWEDLAKAFQAAVLLFCLQTLFYDREMESQFYPVFDDPDTDDQFFSAVPRAAVLRKLALKSLLEAIHRLWSVEPKMPASWCGKFLMWPMFVAGMELDSYPESSEQRLFLCDSLRKLCDPLGDLSPLDAAALLEATYSRSQRLAAMGHIEDGPWVDRLAWTELKGVFFL